MRPKTNSVAPNGSRVFVASAAQPTAASDVGDAHSLVQAKAVRVGPALEVVVPRRFVGIARLAKRVGAGAVQHAGEAGVWLPCGRRLAVALRLREVAGAVADPEAAAPVPAHHGLTLLTRCAAARGRCVLRHGPAFDGREHHDRVPSQVPIDPPSHRPRPPAPNTPHPTPNQRTPSLYWRATGYAWLCSLQHLWPGWLRSVGCGRWGSVGSDRAVACATLASNTIRV